MTCGLAKRACTEAKRTLGVMRSLLHTPHKRIHAVQAWHVAVKKSIDFLPPVMLVVTEGIGTQ